MIRLSMIGLLVLGFAAAFAEAQQPPAPGPAGRAYKVAFWFEFDRPISSLKYQAYDLTKGEYDQKAVDRWLDAIRATQFKYGAYLRDIRTDGEPGATEPERLASAIEKEKRRWTDLQSQGLKSIPKLVETSPNGSNAPRSQPPPGSRVGFDRPSPGAPGGHSNLPTSPIPYPYRSRPL